MASRKEAVESADAPAKKTMTNAHKAALAVGREEGQAVRRYLNSLQAHRPRSGRRRTVATVSRQLEDTVHSLRQASGLDRVHLLQRRIDLDAELRELRAAADGDDDAQLEAAFVKALPGYSGRKHISYRAWREVGVPARVLRAAGIRRGGS